MIDTELMSKLGLTSADGRSTRTAPRESACSARQVVTQQGEGSETPTPFRRGCMTCACGRYQYVQASVNLLWFLEGTVVHYNTTLNIQWYKSENLKTVVSYVSVHAAPGALIQMRRVVAVVTLVACALSRARAQLPGRLPARPGWPPGAQPMPTRGVAGQQMPPWLRGGGGAVPKPGIASKGKPPWLRSGAGGPGPGPAPGVASKGMPPWLRGGGTAPETAAGAASKGMPPWLRGGGAAATARAPDGRWPTQQTMASGKLGRLSAAQRLPAAAALFKKVMRGSSGNPLVDAIQLSSSERKTDLVQRRKPFPGINVSSVAAIMCMGDSWMTGLNAAQFGHLWELSKVRAEMRVNAGKCGECGECGERRGQGNGGERRDMRGVRV